MLALSRFGCCHTFVLTTSKASSRSKHCATRYPVIAKDAAASYGIAREYEKIEDLYGR